MLDTATASQVAFQAPILSIVELQQRLEGVPYTELQSTDTTNQWVLVTDCGAASQLMEHRGFEIIRPIDYDDQAPYSIPFRVTLEARGLKRINNGRFNTLRVGQLLSLPYMGKGWEGNWRITDVKVTTHTVTVRLTQSGTQKTINDVNCGFVVVRLPFVSRTAPRYDFTPKDVSGYVATMTRIQEQRAAGMAKIAAKQPQPSVKMASKRQIGYIRALLAQVYPSNPCAEVNFCHDWSISSLSELTMAKASRAIDGLTRAQLHTTIDSMTATVK